MLEARSVAVVGASARAGSFGHRMVSEVSRSTGPLDVHLVNPRYAEIEGRRCVPSLDAIDGPVDLVLLGVPDAALHQQLTTAARRGDRAAVAFGSVVGTAPDGQPLRAAVSGIVAEAGLALCGGGCMGFVNVTRGLRAIGYVEAEELPAGPIALVSHSGSAFSALLRSHRRLGFSLAVSSGQELAPRRRSTSTTPSTSRRPGSPRCCWRRCARPSCCARRWPGPRRRTCPSSH